LVHYLPKVAEVCSGTILVVVNYLFEQSTDCALWVK
jgi:hypothetical protein